MIDNNNLPRAESRAWFIEYSLDSLYTYLCEVTYFGWAELDQLVEGGLQSDGASGEGIRWGTSTVHSTRQIVPAPLAYRVYSMERLIGLEGFKENNKYKLYIILFRWII